MIGVTDKKVSQDNVKAKIQDKGVSQDDVKAKIQDKEVSQDNVKAKIQDKGVSQDNVKAKIQDKDQIPLLWSDVDDWGAKLFALSIKHCTQNKPMYIDSMLNL